MDDLFAFRGRWQLEEILVDGSVSQKLRWPDQRRGFPNLLSPMADESAVRLALR